MRRVGISRISIRMRRVGITVINYNNGRYVKECLDSIKAQDYEGEIMVSVVDDCSTGKDREILPKLCEKYGVRYWRLPENMGPNAARNWALQPFVNIRGHECYYAVMLDSDDTIPPNYISECVKAIEGFDVCYTPARFFGEREGEFGAIPFHELRLRAQNFIVSSAMFRVEVWKVCGGWDESRDLQILEDWVIWLDALKAGASFTRCQSTWLNYRQKANSRNSTENGGNVRAHNAIIYMRKKYGRWFLG